MPPIDTTPWQFVCPTTRRLLAPVVYKPGAPLLRQWTCPDCDAHNRPASDPAHNAGNPQVHGEILSPFQVLRVRGLLALADVEVTL